MTPIDMETYLDDNLAVYHAALGYRNQQEVCRNLERRRKARERAAAIRRQRRRQAAAILLIVAVLCSILAACAAAGKARANEVLDPLPTSTEPVDIMAGMELLASPSPVIIIPQEREDPLEDLPVWEWPEDVLLAHGYYSVAVPMEYEYQGYMRRYCAEYGIYYTMALAVAEVESTFNMDAVGTSGEVGIMQLNPGPGGSYHDELEAATGLDPTTPEGNIAGGCYLLGKYLAEFGGDVEKTAMAYNMGRSGAKNAWAEGIASTEYSRAVAQAVERWECTVNAWNGV